MDRPLLRGIKRAKIQQDVGCAAGKTLQDGALRKYMKNIVFYSTAFLAFFTYCSKPIRLEQYVFQGATQGTTYTIKIIEPKKKAFDQKVMAQKIDALLQHINQLMSTYADDSELSQLNRK